jgi:ACS family D-galactonate transporter-like MFS transporter
MPPTRQRYRILVMLFFTVVITFLDRSNLSLAATELAGDLKLDPRHLGWILSAFGFTYALLQIPGGWLVDRIRPRILFALVCGLWSMATILQGFAGSFLALISLRLLLGVFEAPTYPILNRAVTTWFPDQERARGIAAYTSGQFVGPGFLMPILALAQHQFGWNAVFFITGALGLVWAGCWYFFYRDPAQSTRINEAELDYIRVGGALVDSGTAKVSATKFTWVDLRLVLSRQKLWGIYFGQMAVNSTLWFFLTWFPTYLVKYRHLDFINAGFLSVLPWLAAFCGIFCSGFVSDRMIQRGVSPTTARKLPIIAGLLLSTTIIGANYVDSPKLIVLFMTIAFFGNGLSSIAWIMVSSLAPKRLLGLTSGVFNFFGNLSSLLVPLIIGYLIKPGQAGQAGNFAPALIFVSAVAFMGALSYIFLVGKVERVE